MKKNINRSLLLSLIGATILSIIIFSSITFYMKSKTSQSINQIGEIYMTEMNQQIQQKFTTIVDLRLSQINGLIQRTPPEDYTFGDEMITDLQLGASVRDFEYLALYTKDGEFRHIYGPMIQELDEQEFRALLTDEQVSVARAINTENHNLLLMIVPAEYDMGNGQKSDALVAGISMDYFKENLFINEEDTTAYSHIVNKDGDFVIRGGSVFRYNYFEQIEHSYSTYEGKTATQYQQDIKEAMESQTSYSTVVLIQGERCHLYMTPLHDSAWYLISIMPFGNLDGIIYELDEARTIVMMAAMGCVIVMLTIIFGSYYRITHYQMIEMEEARKEAVHANAAKSQFLSSMSHDIRTPMNAIVGMTEIAIKNINNVSRVDDCLKKIKLSSKHLLGLINDVLDMSKIESGKMVLNMDQLSLRETMKDIVQIMQPQFKSKNQHFDIFIQSIQSENVVCDHVRLNQILLNLLSNSYKFTPEEGKINVYLSQESSPLGEDYVRNHFIVKDNGIGMSEEFQKHIFDSFSREQSEQVGKISGTGLGMAITKHIVDALNGTIEVESQLNQGSQFHITLDLKKSSIEESEMKLPDCRVLVVDNNEDLCLSAVSSLEELGVHAEYTLSGKEAIRLIEERLNTDDFYQFVLLDWKMPDMDGLHTMQEIQNRIGRQIPIFLISAYDWSTIEAQVLDAGIAGFIAKPLFKSTLYMGLSQYIYGHEKQEVVQETVDFTGKRILIAEDNELNYEIAYDIFTEAGFEVEWAENGSICVDMVKASSLHYYDAILMDLRMPVMNGYQATEAIRALDREDKDLPIIAMSADAFADDVKHCLECGMNAHTAKPIDIDEVMTLFKKYL